MKRRRGTGLALAAVLALSGCGTVVSGTPQADPSASVHLDTGNYPTTPRQVLARTGDDARVQGSYQLADHLVAPAEVNDKLDTTAYFPVLVISDLATLVSSVGMKLGGVLDGHVGGVNVAQKVADPDSTTPEQQMNTILLRYSTPDDAKARLAKLRSGFPPVGGSGAPLAKYPDAFEGGTPEKIGGSPMFWLQHDEYLIGAGFLNFRSRSAVESTVTAYFDKQIARLNTVTFSPAETAKFPQADRDGIMRLTREQEGHSNGARYATAWMSPHAYAMATDGTWAAKVKKLERAGIDLVAHSANTIYRAKEPEGAQMYARLVTEEVGSSPGEQVEPAPGGVPGARCASQLTKANGKERHAYTCTIAVGRYVAVDSGPSLSAAQQGAAASYLVLKEAK